MSDQLLLELLGYAASILVAVSLMMSSLLRLRVINMCGAITFTAYGLLINAYPVAAVNAFIVFVNLYYLRQFFRTRELFRITEVEPDSDILREFVRFYREDIERFMPGFDLQPERTDVSLFVLRDMVPAGVLIGEVHGDTLRVTLDYVSPQYRDLKAASYLFEERPDYFRQKGISRVVSPAGTRTHSDYLRKMGFEPQGEGPEATYSRRLDPETSGAALSV